MIPDEITEVIGVTEPVAVPVAVFNQNGDLRFGIKVKLKTLTLTILMSISPEPSVGAAPPAMKHLFTAVQIQMS